MAVNERFTTFSDRRRCYTQAGSCSVCRLSLHFEGSDLGLGGTLNGFHVCHRILYSVSTRVGVLLGRESRAFTSDGKVCVEGEDICTSSMSITESCVAEGLF